VSRRRVLTTGLAVTVVYLLAVVATAAFRGDGARPLFDGFVPPSSYRFVDPPQFFAPGNVQPGSMATTLALGPDGSGPAGFATPDGQFVVNLARGAIQAAPGATSVQVQVTPIAPRHTRPVPGGLRANGNVYEVNMRYEPTGTQVTRLVRPATLLMELPELGNALFVSPDGTRWTRLRSRPVSADQLTLTANFTGPGFYVAATDLPELVVQPAGAQRSAIWIGIATASGALVLFAVGALVVVRRRRVREGRPAAP